MPWTTSSWYVACPVYGDELIGSGSNMAIQNDILQDYDLVCFVIATTGQGHFPNSSRKFWKNLRRAKLPPNCLDTVQFTTFGLGDSSYHK